MALPQPDLIWIPANAANFMYGRQGTPVRKIAFHHVVGSAASAVSKFQQPVQVSAHFVVASDRIYCMVDTDNTAYCNGNWSSNLESVTIEHEGTWLNGFRDEGVIANSAQLVAWLRSLYPAATPIRHRDVMATACPGDLPVEEIWDRASQILNPPAPVLVDTRPEWLKNRRTNPAIKYANKGNVQLWNLDNPSVPADDRLFAVNQQFNIGSVTNVGGRDYFITAYSTDKNVAAGFRFEDLSDTEYTVPEQPPVIVNPEPAPQPPVVVEPPVVVTPEPTTPAEPQPTPPAASATDWKAIVGTIVAAVAAAVAAFVAWLHS